jgi:hypothetical protein
MITEENTISDESIDLFIDHEELKEYEAEAAKLEVTLDYYLMEFI